jgi:hypothetical protein
VGHGLEKPIHTRPIVRLEAQVLGSHRIAVYSQHSVSIALRELPKLESRTDTLDRVHAVGPHYELSQQGSCRRRRYSTELLDFLLGRARCGGPLELRSPQRSVNPLHARHDTVDAQSGGQAHDRSQGLSRALEVALGDACNRKISLCPGLITERPLVLRNACVSVQRLPRMMLGASLLSCKPDHGIGSVVQLSRTSKAEDTTELVEIIRRYLVPCLLGSLQRGDRGSNVAERCVPSSLKGG